ncbi:CRISPR-associated endonuclease Cas1 [Ktedonobacter sp. SOSP1-85]|uniref:CRISPR-associated endonuclease Cas1 n=1 Tax=Ktedonobacter sp. SOSP1-85 TaxID=2778367 RepID=UPI001915AB13|nr:CRISPR-associated endonuclease Cas1 [Ktedonobacter sp. SOSP1-85]GHO77471.1 CRISPR-associated endonuclease Cas1 [Ktedonobacter sp. SOSP1-85]
MDLIVEGKGLFIGKHQGRVRVYREQKMVQEAPLIHLKQIMIVDSGVGISSDVVKMCSEEGIPIHYLSRHGRTIAGLYTSGLVGTILTRRAQLLAYDTPQGVMVGKAFVSGKIQNQLNLLRYFAKSRKESEADFFQVTQAAADTLRDRMLEVERLSGETIQEIRDRLLSAEGRAAQCYWGCIARILPETLQWPGRETQGAKDLFNSLLNYGYGVLYAQVEQAILLGGLDPYAGFLHADRPGKPSLVLDLIEEFRQCVVDRTVIGLINKHVQLEQDEERLLTESTRRKLAEKVLERLDGSAELYEGKRQALRFILQNQARHLASFLRGDRACYDPFIAGW